MVDKTTARPLVVGSRNFERDKRCPDYDCDCVKVQEPLACWRGGGITGLDPAEGYCPMILGLHSR